MADYMWTIQKDYLDGEDTGTMGPYDVTKEDAIRLSESSEGMAFRMYDDDDELYYEGILYGEDVDGFEPLDDFGMPNAGCTYIKYHNATTKEWETL